ncbi:MAG: TolC family protein [Tannerella sp.]|jgi:outer membrane protein TolC|nr:TolC family protein [Tannerella sp.]
MKRIFWIFTGSLFLWLPLCAQQRQLDLKEAIRIAQLHSVDAAVALNELRTAYWQYRAYQADQLPEVVFTGTLPAYNNNYDKYQQSDGSYTYVQDNSLALDGEVSVNQNIALTGGKVSLSSSLDFNRQLGTGAYNEFMSLPVSLTLTQPIFGVNDQKWNRRIEPLRYREAKASYLESVEDVTVTTITNFFNLLSAQENLEVAKQNLDNADKLQRIAVARRKIGQISESELMQLNLSALQAKGLLTEAESNLRAQMFQMRSFLGLSEQDTLVPVLPERIPPMRMDYNEVLEMAQENNAFAKRMARTQLEADYAVATAKGNLRSISLNASIGYTGTEHTIAGAYNPLRGNQVVEVGLSIPLLDWGKRKAKVKTAESNRELLLSQNRQEEQNFNQNIFLLVENFNNQATQLEIAEKADTLASKRYATAIEAFMLGHIDILDLNDARNSKDEARLKHVTELQKYWTYYYDLRGLTLYDFIHHTNLDADFRALIRNK